MNRKRILAMLTLIGALLILFSLIGGAAGQEEDPPPPEDAQHPDQDGAGLEEEPVPAEPVPAPEEVQPQLNYPEAPAANLGTPFTYQGELLDDGSPADGVYDFRFRLYDADAGGTLLGTVTQANLDVSEGVFTTKLNFGDVFDGQARWLQIEVAPGGTASYTPLSPRQELVAAPYAQSLRPGASVSGSVGSLGLLRLYNSSGNALYVGQATGSGLFVTNPGSDGVFVDAPGDDGYSVYNSLGDGLYVLSAGSVGVRVQGSTDDGLRVTGAGGDGVSATSTNAAAYGGYFSNSAAGGTGIYANGTTDLLLAGAGVIANTSSSGPINFRSGGDFYVHTDNDDNGTFGEFIVYDGAGTTNADKMIEVQEDRRMYMWDTGGNLTYYLDADTPDGGAYMELRGPNGSVSSGGVRLEAREADTGGQIELFNDSGVATITLDAEQGNGNPGRITSQVIRITGGSDLSEQFDVRARAGAEPEEGLVVCIDAEQPGALVVCDAAYDKKVAGVISGAGDVQPGLLMGQEGSVANGEHPIALTGRVYVWADAATGAIEPGDLLTTGKRLGHAMKVTDHDAAQGAILGKAMTALDQGQGLVLVLITLQ